MTHAMWMPDWTAANAYPRANALRLLQWSWEFLRRSPRYQTLYDELIRPFVDKNDGGFDSDAARNARANMEPRDRNALAIFRREFGVRILPPPPESSVEDYIPEVGWVRVLEGQVNLSLKVTEIGVVFDLSLPLAPQIEEAARWVEEVADDLRTSGKLPGVAESRNRRNLWPEYLRLLDAAASGATTKDMAAVIYPRLDNDSALQTARNRLKAAQEMRDGGYRHINFKGKKAGVAI